MKKIHAHLLSLLLLVSAPSLTESSELGKIPSKISTNNRILHNINGNSISVLDLKKKMDVVFYQQFPQHVRNLPLRYQFYQNNWIHVLNQMIDTELIINDAEEKELPVTDVDIRKEMEETFGNTPLETIDSLDLTYKEAWEQVKKNLLVQRMMIYMVNMKAQVSITPADVQAEYLTYVKEQKDKDTWIYRVLTIKDDNEEAANRASNRAYELLVEEDIPLEGLIEALECDPIYEPTTLASLSSEFKQENRELSDAYKKILSLLPEGFYSSPVKHMSRTSNKDVLSIFQLRERIHPDILPLAEVHQFLRDKIQNQAMNIEADQYLNNLRIRYEISEQSILETLPENFSPFSLN